MYPWVPQESGLRRYHGGYPQMSHQHHILILCWSSRHHLWDTAPLHLGSAPCRMQYPSCGTCLEQQCRLVLQDCPAVEKGRIRKRNKHYPTNGQQWEMQYNRREPTTWILDGVSNNRYCIEEEVQLCMCWFNHLNAVYQWQKILPRHYHLGASHKKKSYTIQPIESQWVHQVTMLLSFNINSITPPINYYYRRLLPEWTAPRRALWQSTITVSLSFYLPPHHHLYHPLQVRMATSIWTYFEVKGTIAIQVHSKALPRNL